MKRGALTLILLGLAQPGLAEGMADNFQVHAFAALNPLTTSSNEFFGGGKDQVSDEFWELGINGSWRPHNDVLVSAQLTSRSAGGTDDGEFRMDYGLVDYSPINTQDTRAGIRIGRVLNPLGFHNETRDVAFTRSSILLPQSIYFDRTRDLALSSDGLQFHADHQTTIGDVIFQANIGLPRAGDQSTELALLGGNFPGDLEGELSVLGRVIVERDGGRWRFGVSGGAVGINYDPAGAGDPLPKGDIDFRPLIVSAQYNTEKLSLTTEFGTRRFARSGFGQSSDATTGESFYLEGLYRFSPKWEAFLRYDVLFSDQDDRSGKDFAERDPRGRPAHTRFAKDLTAGLTWRVNKSVLLRAEYHYVDGTAWLPLADNPNPADYDRYWSIFALQAAFRY